MKQSQVDLSQFRNEWFDRGAPRWKELCWMVVSAVFFRHSLGIWNGAKCGWLRIFGARVGRGVLIKPQVQIKFPWKLGIGDNCWIGEHTWIDNLAEVTLGANVCISQGAMLLTGNHDYGAPAFDLITRPIYLHDGVWIGARSLVCPGVTCHSHAVLSVQSVATHDLDAYGIYRGNPAEKIRDRVIGMTDRSAP
ncbi:MAG: colanic acid biosynthesis acetyltransferase WcaF [Lewinellaceae bacterium]|nr:colanic acid biosynthesis acetyltransferase WcaF [Lewinellaceae bacterium]